MNLFYNWCVHDDIFSKKKYAFGLVRQIECSSSPGMTLHGRGGKAKIPPDSRTARRLTYNTSRDRLFRRLRFNLERSASLRVAEQSRTSVLSPITLNVTDGQRLSCLHERS